MSPFILKPKAENKAFNALDENQRNKATQWERGSEGFANRSAKSSCASDGFLSDDKQPGTSILKGSIFRANLYIRGGLPYLSLREK